MLTIAGCGHLFDDVEPHRDVVIKQWTQPGFSQSPLAVDPPAGWNADRVETAGPAGPITTINVYTQGPFRVVLVPTTTPATAASTPPAHPGDHAATASAVQQDAIEAASGPPVSLRCQWYIVEGHLRVNYQVANARRLPIFVGDPIVLSYRFHALDAMGKEISVESGGGNAVFGGPGPGRYDLLKGIDTAEWTDAVRGSTTSPLDVPKDPFDRSKSYVECTAYVLIRTGSLGKAEEINLTCKALGAEGGHKPITGLG